MIGDNYNTDIVGAKSAGMDQIFFNSAKRHVKENITHRISSLIELKEDIVGLSTIF